MITDQQYNLLLHYKNGKNMTITASAAKTGMSRLRAVDCLSDTSADACPARISRGVQDEPGLTGKFTKTYL